MKKMALLFLMLVPVLFVSAQKSRPPDKLGVVSYTFRNSFGLNLEATLDTVQLLGFNNVEFSNLFGRSPESLRASLDRRGMHCTSYGVSYDDAINKTHDVARAATILGAEFVRVAWIPFTGSFDLAMAEKTVKNLNMIGKILKTGYDLTFCYHNHGYEFGIWQNNETFYDYIVQKTDPAFVSLELDILWGTYREC